MGTHAGIGFRHKGVDWIQYNHNDSGMAWLGLSLLKFCRTQDVSHMRQRVERLKRVATDKSPTAAQLKKVAEQLRWTPEELEEELKGLAKRGDEKTSWYNVFRGVQGELDEYMNELNFWPDDGNYLRDGWDCEWGYIVNLDDETLEVYTSHYNCPGNDRPYYRTVKPTGRYAEKAEFDEDLGRSRRGVTLIDTIPLKAIREVPEPALKSLAQRIDKFF